MWRQESRKLWFKEGNRNTQKFHTRTIKRRRANKIDRIKNEVGKWLTTGEDIGTEFCKYFQNVTSLRGSRDFHVVKEVIKPSISMEEYEGLLAIPSESEIKDAVFHLGPLKSPGPDGHLAKFY